MTSFLTGITEPLEFSFLFVAPVLYLIHAFLDGLAFMMADIFNITVGQTFSGGFIDYILFGVYKVILKRITYGLYQLESFGSAYITLFLDS